jgi:hypothetical protein
MVQLLKRLVKKKEKDPVKQAEGELYAMKVLKKSEILRRNQVEHTMTERRILVSCYINHT